MADKKKEAEAEAPAEGEEGEEGAKKKGPPKLIIFGGLGVVILLLVGVAVFLLFFSGKKDDGGHEDPAHVEEGQDDGHGGGADSHGGDDGHGGGDSHGASSGGHGSADSHGGGGDGHGASGDHPYFYEMQPILVNMNTGDGRPQILALTLSLEITNPDLVPTLEERMPQVVDQYMMFLRELRPEDLYGSAGSHRLRLELLRRVNLVLAPQRVESVLIVNQLVQ